MGSPYTSCFPVSLWVSFSHEASCPHAKAWGYTNYVRLRGLNVLQGCDRTAEASPPLTQSFWNQKDYPWTLVRLLPNAQHYTVGRFKSRTEAENHKRFLGKWMPAAEFEVVFDADAVT